MYLIFDFDGTLVDSFAIMVEKFNLLAHEFKFRKIALHEIPELKNLSSRELIKFLQIPFYKIPRIISKARTYLQKDILTAFPFPGIIATLEELIAVGFSLGIVTSNSKENVIAWLMRYRMNSYFKFIHIESNYFGKRRVLKKVIKTHCINEKKAFYVGDETRDIEAAKQCHLTSIAVTWGFNSEKILIKHAPRYIVRKPEEIVEIARNAIPY